MNRQIEIPFIAGDSEKPRQERADAAANRKLILATAEKLFVGRGVEAVTMADIAQAAAVGKGTLYRRYVNKPQLCLALMDKQMLTFQNEVLDRLREQSIRQVPTMEQLNLFLESLVYFVDRHMPLLCEVQRAGLVSTVHEQQMPHIWQYMTTKGLLNAAVQTGELSPAIDTEYIADALLAPLRVALFRFQREVRGFSLARIVTGLQTWVDALAAL